MPSAITRTAWIDDDGTGTTGTVLNNAEKTILYNQIDAYAGGTVGTWTPADGSGAGLALTVYGARYCQIGKIVLVQAHFAYPATANGNPSAVIGLPVANGSNLGGLYPSAFYGHAFQIASNNTYFIIVNGSSGATRLNSELSGQAIIVSGLYLTA